MIVDDEPMTVAGIVSHLDGGREPGAMQAVGLDRPRRLATLQPPMPVTHAVVDLSYGRHDLDGCCLAPELETGTDAIDLLVGRWPEAAIVVATRNDTELATEMAVAIRETWPSIAFFHKADDSLGERVAAFVAGRHYQDNAEIALDLAGVGPVGAPRLRRVVESTGRPRPTARLVLGLADQVRVPAQQAIAEELGVRPSYIRSLAYEVTGALFDRDMLRADQGGLYSLWLWARARRAIVRRALAPLVA